MVAQRAVDIVQVGKVVIFEITFRARVFLTERVLGIESVVAPMLAGDERGHIGCPRGHAVTHVHINAIFEHAIHHAAAENSTKAAAYINHCGLCHTKPPILFK